MLGLTAIQDVVLQQLFWTLTTLLHSTLLRLLFAINLLPVYCLRQAISVLPTATRRLPLILTRQGREKLVSQTEQYRIYEEEIAAKQYDGSYKFTPANVLPWDGRTSWPVNRKVFEICEINVRVTHTKPKATFGKAKPIVLLHGNPSWSYIWRRIIRHLTAVGYEVFAIDWLGHGTSDKPVNVSEISFELHMHTLRRVIEQLDLHDFYIAAHDWGGCVALCTIPTLPDSRHCAGLFLLNSFFPARPSDISTHYYLLYWIWFFSTGILGPLLPDSFVLRFMAPNISMKTASAYSAPYAQSMFKTKASISRFSHIVPGLPDWVYDLRSTYSWRVVEGWLGPEHFTNLNAQASLAERNRHVRGWWLGEFDDKSTRNAPEKVMILFGREDPLLPEFKMVLERYIGVSHIVRPADRGWLPGAGHYPMEQKPEEIAYCIAQLSES
ncbi:haloalkane dehalogenase family protein [Exophiala viscosa]|uniref:haloalkane dehalogenase family protein n=1 Tax=Exophiala viscosa TaxID=2486360 RepID=UPI00218F9FA6|nr:haloalkane dehalogenase family protein [Exophiala viscosa]